MPIDPTPDGTGILNKPVVKPFPQPTPKEGEEGGRAAQEEETSPDSLAGRDQEEPSETTRPPLGN